MGAPLQPHQNPSDEEFWGTDSGYGNKLASAYPRETKHFAVLGHLGRISAPQRDGWVFTQPSWGVLAAGFQQRFAKTRLLCDLKNCLAEFAVWEFATMKIREVHIPARALGAGAAAWQILRQAYLRPELRLSRSSLAYRLDAELGETAGWHFGIEIQSLANKGLQMLIRPCSAMP